MAIVYSDTARNALANALAALFNSGSIQFQTSGDVEVATCAFSATAFGSAASGVVTANAISDDTDAAGGTIAKASFRNSGATEILTCSVTVTGGGGDITGASVVIAAGETVSVDSLTLTQPAS